MRGSGEPRCHLPWPHARVVPVAASSGDEARGRGWGTAMARVWGCPSCPEQAMRGTILILPSFPEVLLLLN
jgi:hypothetical protein